MEVFVRPADRQDAVNLMHLIFQLQDESNTFIVEQDPNQIEVQEEADNIDILQTTTNNIMLVSKTETGQLVGLVSAAAMPGQPKVAEIGVAVINDFQGHGLAQAMLAELCDWAQTFSTVEKMMLTVQTSNAAAIHIYEKIGFKRVVGSEKMVLNSDHENVPAFDMTLVVVK